MDLPLNALVAFFFRLAFDDIKVHNPFLSRGWRCCLFRSYLNAVATYGTLPSYLVS